MNTDTLLGVLRASTFFQPLVIAVCRSESASLLAIANHFVKFLHKYGTGMISSDPQQAASLYISSASLKCFHRVTRELDRGPLIGHCLARPSFRLDGSIKI